MDHSPGDACHIDCATTHTISRDEKYFSNITLVPFNVQTLSGPVDLIKGYGRATIVMSNGTKFQIDDALYSNKSNQNLLSFKDIHRNGYHIETMSHNGNEYLLITDPKSFLLWHERLRYPETFNDAPYSSKF